MKRLISIYMRRFGQKKNLYEKMLLKKTCNYCKISLISFS